MTTSPLSSPFLSIGPAAGRDFYGREEVLRSIFDAIKQHASIALIGPKLMGKSSLLAHVESQEVQKRFGLNPDLYAFARVACSRVRTGSMLAQFATLATRKALGPHRQDLLLAEPSQGSPSWEESRPEGRPLGSLAQVAKALQEGGGGLVLMLDDFEMLLALPEAQLMTDLLGLAAVNVSLIVTSTRRLASLVDSPDLGDARTTLRFQTYHSRPLETLLTSALRQQVVIGPLSDDEALGILKAGFADVRLNLPAEVASTVLTQAGGHPALLKAAAHVSYEVMAQTGALSADAIDRMEVASQSYLSALLRSLPPTLQSRVRALARASAEGQSPPPDVALDLALRTLYVLKDDGVTLFSPMFTRFLIHTPALLDEAETPPPGLDTSAPATSGEILRTSLAQPQANSARGTATVSVGFEMPSPTAEMVLARPAPGSRLWLPFGLVSLALLFLYLWQSPSPISDGSPSQGVNPTRELTELLLFSGMALILGWAGARGLLLTRPAAPSHHIPRDEVTVMNMLRAALTRGHQGGAWQATLLGMAGASTLDHIADARFALVDLDERIHKGESTVPEHLALQLTHLLTTIVGEARAASEAVSSNARGAHLALAITRFDELNAACEDLESGLVRDGLWLVGRVWRRILVDALESSAGKPSLRAVLCTPQVRHAEQVDVEVEVVNMGEATAMRLEIQLLPPVGAQLASSPIRTVGTLEPEVPYRARFSLRPHRREAVYLTFQIRHRDPIRGELTLQLNERLTFVELTGPYRRVDPNPYITGKPVGPGQIFVGRREDLAFLKEAVLESAVAPTILIIGRRRMGKTSLLRHIPGVLGEQALTVWIDYQGRPTDKHADLLRWMCQRVCSQIPGNPVPPVDDADFERDPGGAFLRYAIEPLTAVAAGRKVVVLIDELESLFDPMDKGTLDPRFFENMRALVQGPANLSLVLAGTPHLAARGGDVRNVLFGAALTREISFLEPEDLAALLKEPLRPYNIEVAPMAIDRLYLWTGGHPLLSQHLCFHLVRRLNQLQVGFVTGEDVDAVVAAASEGAQDHLNLWWNQNNAQQRWVLVALAVSGPTPRSPAQLQEQLLRFGVRAPQADVRELLTSLVSSDLLRSFGATGAVAYRQELFRCWVERLYGSPEARSRLNPWENKGEESRT